MDTNDDCARDFLRSIAKYRSRLKHRLVVLESLSEEGFRTINTGIVFVQAPWSGQSVLALQTIARLLTDVFDSVWLYIVPIDKMFIDPKVFGKVSIGGYGETLWLRQGQIVYTGSAYDDRDVPDLTTATEAMLQAPTEIFDKSLARRQGA